MRNAQSREGWIVLWENSASEQTIESPALVMVYDIVLLWTALTTYFPDLSNILGDSDEKLT
jgi:hypothetical protein